MAVFKKDIAYEEIKLDIISGRYPVGSKLPKELDFARERRISFLTLRAALKRLEADGLIARLPSKGTFVLKDRPDVPPPPIFRILLLLPDYEPDNGDLFNRDLILGAVEGAYLAGAEVRPERTADPVKLPERFAAGEFHGIIWDRPEEAFADTIETLRRSGVAQATVNRCFPGIPALGCDYPAGMRAMMRYWRGIGHWQVGLIDLGHDWPVFRERQATFMEQLRLNGVAEPESHVLRMPGEPATDWLRIADWHRRLPQLTALLVSGVYMPDLVRYLESALIDVPARLSVLQFGEREGFSLDSESPFSIFTDPRRQIGCRALRRVCRQLAGEPDGPEKELIVGELISRKSCALPAGLSARPAI